MIYDDPEFEDLDPDLIAGSDEAAPEKLLAHSGYVVVVGKPNVGKSTLMNRFLGEKVAIVSPKPQTTRLRQLGIYTKDDVQAVFVDTPGVHQPHHRLGEFMLDIATQALSDADVILFVCDMSNAPDDEDQRVAKLVNAARQGIPVVLALNKIDRAKPEHIIPNSAAYRALVPDADWTTLSASKGDGVDDLFRRVIEKLPAGPQYFPDDQVSDLAMRDIAAEIVREKALLNLDQEVPHAVAVEVEEYKERSPTLTYIRMVIYVERESHKAILIGKGGAMLKKISSEARQDLEAFIGTQVYLEPWVKVLKNWRQDENVLRRLGYRLRT